MANAREVLKSLDAAEIRQRLEDLDREKEALRVLLRAAARNEKRQALALSGSPTPKQEGRQ
jgi:hypothetical protein